ncbi:MAG: type 4a pilus biogenesis protein PilO [Deltaproteobacteria bacterium]|nr:type 4a pilus biogenesis protein PilO [Deltaproteobacteria bacterium]
MKSLSLPPRIERIVIEVPFKQKILIYIGILAALVAVFVVILIGPQFRKIGKLHGELEDTLAILDRVKHKAANLAQFKAELEVTKAQFQQALLLLPDKKEIPSLLTNISSLGNEAGLEFILFKPKEETPKDFYAEIPVEIIVEGPYHNVAVFFDKVSKLPRIVNISNVSMTDPKKAHGTMMVKTSCLATTYRFAEGEPGEDKQKKQ